MRALGAVPAREGTKRAPADLGAGIERLRAFLAGEEPDMTPEQLAQWIARYKPENARRALGRSSGWREVPQCGGCKALIKHPGAQCKVCGYMDGGGYLGVPAKTSHLERWR